MPIECPEDCSRTRAKLNNLSAALPYSALSAFEWLDTPLWAFDLARRRMAWANPAGLSFWKTDTLEELLARNFSDMTEATLTRNEAALREHAAGRRVREQWTVFPRDIPITVTLESTGITLADGSIGILYAVLQTVSDIEPRTLRAVEAMQHTTVRISLHQKNGVALLRNPSAIRTFGDCNEVAEQDDLAAMFYHGADVARLRKSVDSGCTFSAEVLLATLDGPRWHGLDARTVRDPVTAQTCTLINARDISDTKQISASNPADEERWHMLAANLTDMICRSTLDGKILYVSPACRSLLGHSETEMCGRQQIDFIHPEDRAAVLSIMSEYPSRGDTFSSTHRLLHRQGHTVWVEQTASTVRDRAGQPQEIVAVIRNIGERMRREVQESARTRAFERLAGRADLQDILQQVVAFMELEREDLACSVLLRDKDDRLYLAATGKLPAFYCTTLDGLEIAEGARCCGTAAFRGERVVLEDIREHAWLAPVQELIRQAGLVSCWSEPIKDADGQVLGVLAIYQRQAGTPTEEDSQMLRQAAYLARIAIERRRTEREIRELTVSLERRVRERTAELEQANQELEAFSYSTSHDLRAPLRALNGFSHILLEEESAHISPRNLHLLERIAANATHMGELIDDILDYSRAGRLPLKRQKVDLDSLARSVAEELSETYPHARMEISALPTVHGDPTMLRQILYNLMGNACKFSARRAEPRIRASAEAQSRPGEGQVILVEDNGIGFDMQYADRLFSMFQRIHSEKDFSGTGVGLAIVKRLVERHGGRVRVEAEPDRGATFRFTLPERKAER